MLYPFDRAKTKEMISFLNNSANDAYINRIMFNPFMVFHHMIPLNFKFLPESYVLENEGGIKGLITVAPQKGKHKKMLIQKLFFEENDYETAAELIQFVSSKYKAKGAVSLIVKVDDYLPELLKILVSRCGFSQISYEKLWRITKRPERIYNGYEFRMFRNSDANDVAVLYNECLLPHFRTLLKKDVSEFKDSMFRGLSYSSEYKYVITDNKNIVAYISSTTSDNENFVLDITQSSWIDIDMQSIIAYAVAQIKKRRKRFGLFIKTKRYMNLGEKFETELLTGAVQCVQNSIVLTNSSLKLLKGEVSTGKYTVLGNFKTSGTLLNN